jgi:hypothetical protein
MPDMSNLQLIKESLILGETTFSYNKILNQGDFMSILQILQTISSLMNEQSLSDKFGLISGNFTQAKFPQINGPLEKYAGVIPVRNFYLVFTNIAKIKAFF